MVSQAIARCDNIVPFRKARLGLHILRSMRPEVLFRSFAPLTSLAGVGPRISALIKKIAGPHLVDLYWHFPIGFIDRRFTPPVADAPTGRIATISIRVERHYPSPNRRLPYKIRCSDDTGTLWLVFFRARADYLRSVLPEGAQRIVSGKVENYSGELQMTHPDHIGAPEDTLQLAAIEPVYPLTAGLNARNLSKAIRQALGEAPNLPEWIEVALLEQRGWLSWQASLVAVHSPESDNDLVPTTAARSRLAFDELLANQLALGLVRLHMRQGRGRAIRPEGSLRERVFEALPYKLTIAQINALAEIDADLERQHPMTRLLQGDVGSGKTIIALLTMLSAVETGAQAAMMVPTELLARQHGQNLAPLCEAAGVRLAVVTGRDSSRVRRQIGKSVAAGEVDILIGTHALFQDQFSFRDLAMIVIDEQHRFGVHQRLALSSKGTVGGNGPGPRPDMLLMTATPIPRTLALTVYGDMEVSRITELPANRQPVETRALALDRLDDVIEAVRRTIADEARVYWVCPLVSESEAIDLAAAEERFAALRQVFGEQVGLIHGQMKAEARHAAMQRFIDGDIQILIATTVIEVGVDVPEATIMVIEHAERFGLAQLHQLRGRVGRGPAKGTCLLLYSRPLGEAARTRIRVLRETNDGFLIAEEDFRLRGAGELLGTRQSGMPQFRVADLEYHADLLADASDIARLEIGRNPDLRGPEGERLRTLLYLFERDQAVLNLRSG